MSWTESMCSDTEPGPGLAQFDTDFPSDGPLAYIYGLHDPRTGELRYIGKSVRPRQRVRNQMNERANTHRGHWLAELRRLGVEPIQVIIDAVPADSDWQAIERVYIAAARASGARLTNGTDGGDGVSGLSMEARERIASTWRGRRATPEHRAKLVAAMARRGPPSSETRERMRTAMIGREFTLEWRQKISSGLQKLTAEQVREIRRHLAMGQRQRDIADRFGVHQGSVSNIARGLTYRDVMEA